MSVLKVQTRPTEVKAKALRKSGMVPMALVEKGGNTMLIQAQATDVRRALSLAHGAGMIDVEIEGEKNARSVVVKSVDRDILSRSLTHVTVQAVNKDDTIKVDLPIIAVGMPQLVTDGEGVLMHPTDHIKVRGKISDIPDNFEIDISGLGLHESITAGQVVLPPGVELMSSPDAQLFSVTFAKEMELEAAPEGEASAEVPTVAETETSAE
jgi:large subunit ribosomal protein L25